jgi:outer membrane protein TolC
MGIPFLKLCVICFICLLPSFVFGDDTIPSYDIGIVTDGNSEEDLRILAVFQKELQTLADGEYHINFPESATLSGNNSRQGAENALNALYKNPEVDLVITLGYISSYLAYHGENPPKPVIAPYILDGLIREHLTPEAKMTHSNLASIDTSFSLDRDLLIFQKIVPAQNLVIIVDSRLLEAIPEFKLLGKYLANENSIKVSTIPANNSADAVLDALPPDTDSVMIGTLYQFSDTETTKLLQGLIAKKLPGYAIWDRSLVINGLLMGDLPEEMQDNLARRTAIAVQDILLGETAGSLNIQMNSGHELTINMATARALDIYPGLAIMTGANLLQEERTDIKRHLSLQQVVTEALEVNLDYLSADQSVLAGIQAVAETRAPLLPQISIATGARAIDNDRAELGRGSSPERAWTGTATASQQIYSERSWARYAIEQHLQSGRELDRDRVRLDTIYAAAVAYFNVLRTKTIEQLEKDNLKLTHANLKRARIRMSTGVAGPDEVYRWETKNAADSRSVLEKESLSLDAMQNLNRLLNRPLQELFIAEETDLSNPLLMAGNRFFLKMMDNPRYLLKFTNIAIREALSQRPELQSLDAVITAKERQTTSSKREFWVPDFTIEGQVEQYFTEDGSGQRGDFKDSLDDTDWQIGVYARLPLFEGGRKTAALSRNQQELLKLKIDRRSLAERISQDILRSLNRTRASYPGISLTRDGADSANRNLDLITDSYTQGIKSIIELLDAQNQALTADQAAANAVYNFLIDLMGVQRSMGFFVTFQPEAERNEWIGRTEALLEQ